MGVVIVLLVIAVIAGAVVWNKRTAGAAMEGVEFGVLHDPAVVSTALRASYCGGTRAMMKSMFSGLTVTAAGPTSFRVESRLGDVGEIVVEPAEGGAVVRAHTLELYVGSHPKTHFKRGFLGVGAIITHRIYQLLGITPGAARMKSFQRKVEGRVAKELNRSMVA